MIRDQAIQEQVVASIGRALGAHMETLGVAVYSGVVRLNGVVDTPAERAAVEQATWSVNGVRAIAERLRVRRTFDNGPSDTALALAVLRALEREPAASGCRPRVRVDEGHVTVIGAFAPYAPRDAIVTTVAAIAGVRGVSLEDAEIPHGRTFDVSTYTAANAGSRTAR